MKRLWPGRSAGPLRTDSIIKIVMPGYETHDIALYPGKKICQKPIMEL